MAMKALTIRKSRISQITPYCTVLGWFIRFWLLGKLDLDLRA
jgi:hypothetical protein